MIDFSQIHNQEYGLTVRAKLNSMLKALIDGGEGVNTLWASLANLNNNFSTLKLELNTELLELKDSIKNNRYYTDECISDILTYINGIKGGVSGFAIDLDYEPNFKFEDPATVLAVEIGTYKNMLDADGNPITITEQDGGSFTIFYKGANTDKWMYKNVPIRPKVKCKCKEIFNVHYRYGVEMPTTLEVAINSVPEEDRIPGQFITFMEKKDWRLFQFRGESVEDYLDTSLWYDMSGEGFSYIRLKPTALEFEDFNPKSIEIITSPYNLSYTIRVTP